ncbi:biopolymer transporter ExbD [Photobacterium damselae]|uniref:Biopolymer transporter ExbD n=1 Tax=Photobacterium damselae TaxID=38293 RepID=A0ACD3T607_PHODM|nr:biopolymer transporter ExbD [Photobacterium damselae]AWK82037.1 biopolymer transporter ExbD [Photobacterium damselae]RDL28982.1 biopolymer transporter ExbD [Photobacterium damselae]TMX49049.1 biopolymer transporter ExbD [Photobacterium damselae]TMX70520.1 biopolymer transporter ExbD [Photobacterium damselae]TMX79038.1 biopolymer transporter ExbD [Photobacterium damselae]
MITTGNNRWQNDELSPDLTPLLDIIFIVMVFLLLTASVKIKSLNVDLPQTETQILQTTSADPITINLLASEPHWALDGNQQKSWEAFSTTLLDEVKANPSKPVVIGAEKTASVEQMLKLLAFLQKNDIKATQLLMEEDNKA